MQKNSSPGFTRALGIIAVLITIPIAVVISENPVEYWQGIIPLLIIMLSGVFMAFTGKSPTAWWL